LSILCKFKNELSRAPSPFRLLHFSYYH